MDPFLLDLEAFAHRTLHIVLSIWILLDLLEDVLGHSSPFVVVLYRKSHCVRVQLIIETLVKLAYIVSVCEFNDDSHIFNVHYWNQAVANCVVPSQLWKVR